MSRRANQPDSGFVSPPKIAVAFGIGPADSAQRNFSPVFVESAAGDIAAGIEIRALIGREFWLAHLLPLRLYTLGSLNFNASLGPGDLKQKLLTMRRKWMLNMKHFVNSPTSKSCSQFDMDAVLFESITESYEHFR